MTERKDIMVRIPVSIRENGINDVTAYFPSEMTQSEWAQFHHVLEAMRPVLAPDLAVGAVQEESK